MQGIADNVRRKSEGVREVSSGQLKIGDRVFISSFEALMLERKQSKTPIERLELNSSSQREFFLACSNTKGVNMDLCTQSHLNAYSYIGIFEVLPKISSVEGIESSKVTQDQMELFKGKEIKYGDRIVLRHLYSGGYLAPNLKSPSKMRGSWKLELRDAEPVNTEFLPSSLSKSLGDPVLIDDLVSIVFTLKNKKLFMNVDNSLSKKLIPAAHLVSSNWKISLFQKGDLDSKKIFYGSPIQIKGHALNLRLSKHSNTKPPENAVYLKGKESCYDMWVLERLEDDKPYSMKGGYVHFDEKLFIRNLATNEYLTKDLQLVGSPQSDDYFQFSKGSIEYFPQIRFGVNIIVKNSEGKIICINEESYVQSSLAKAMYPIKKFRGSTKKSAPISLYSSSKNISYLFEILKPSSSTARTIRKLNQVSSEFKEYSKFIDEYLVNEHSIQLLKFLVSPSTHELTLETLMEELNVIVMMLVSMLRSLKNLTKLKKIQNFMEKLNIHRASLDLLNSITNKIGLPESSEYSLTPENNMKMRNTSKNLWTFLKKATENNPKVCFKMSKHLRFLVQCLKVFPEKASNYMGIIIEGSFPDIEILEDFAKELFYELGSIRKDSLMVDTNCFNIANHSFLYKGEILRAHQEIIRKIFIQRSRFFPVSFQVEEFSIFISIQPLNGAKRQDLMRNNPDLEGVCLQNSEKELKLPLEEFVIDAEYTEYLIKYLKLYRFLYDGVPVKLLEDAYSKIGLNSYSIESAISNSRTPLMIKKEFIFLAVSYILSRNLNTQFNNLCIPIKETNTNKDRGSDSMLIGFKTIESSSAFISKLWETYTKDYSKEPSLDIERFILSLLENSVSLGMKCIFPVKDFESISECACRFIKEYLFYNSRKIQQDQMILLKRIVINTIKLLELYTQQKFTDIGRSIVFSFLEPSREQVFHRTLAEDNLQLSVSPLQSPQNNNHIKLNKNAIQFSELISDALMSIILISNKIDNKIHLKVLKLLKKFYSPTKYFAQTFRKIEMYLPSISDKYIESITASRSQLCDPNLINALKSGIKDLEIHKMKELRCIMGKIITLIDSRISDKYQVFHIQNLMRNYEMFEKVLEIWKIIKHDTDDQELEKKRLKTISVLVSFTHAFVNNNSTNSNLVKRKLNWKLFEQISLLSSLIQRTTQFSHLNTQKIRSYIDILIRSFLFVPGQSSSTMIKWIIALIYKDSKKFSYETQSFVADKILLQLSYQGNDWDLLEDKVSIGESLYILSFCCILNETVRDQCKFYFKISNFVNYFKEDYPFSLKRGVINLMYRLYYDNVGFENTHEELEEECLKLLDCFHNSLRDIQAVAEKGIYEAIPPKRKSYRVEIKQSKEFHNETLFLAWTVCCHEYTYGKTGLLYFLPDILKTNKRLASEAVMKLNSLKDQVLSIFENEYHIEALCLDIDNSIKKLEGKVVFAQQTEIFSVSTSHNEEQQANSILSSVFEDMNASNLQKEKKFDKCFTKKVISESSYFANLVSNKLSEEDKNQIKQFIKFLLLKSTTLEQIRNFYGFLNCLFMMCKKKRMISELLIQSNIISESLNFLQNTIRPRLQLIVLEFFSTICRQKTTIVQELVLKHLVSLNITFFLFNNISETLKTTVMSCLDYKEISDSSFKFRLSVRYLKFLASLCDNCNTKLQEFMESQVQYSHNSSKNINLLRVIFELTTDLTENVEYLSNRKTIKTLVMHALETLIEFTTGPCRMNQLFLIKNIQTYLIVNSLFSIVYDFDSPLDLDLFTSTVNFLLLLTEEDPNISKKVPKYLDITLIANQINSLYEEIHLRKEQKQYKQSINKVRDEKKDIAKTLLKNGVSLMIFIIKFEIVFPYHSKLQGLLKPDNNSFYGNSGLSKYLKTSGDYVNPTSKSGERQEIAYFKQYIGCVEIEKENAILKHYFQIPYHWKNLTAYTAKRFIESADHTSRADKLENLIEEVFFAIKEMSHQSKIKKDRFIKLLSKHWKFFGRINYAVLLIVNVLILILATNADGLNAELSAPQSEISIIADLGSMVLIILALLSVLGYVFEYYPTIILRSHRSEKRKVKVSTLLSKSRTVVRSRNTNKDQNEYIIDKSHVRHISKRKKILYLLMDNYILYQIGYLIIASVSVKFPIFYSFLLLDVMRISDTLRDVFRSLTKNLKQLILTFILGCICIYIYSNIGFLYLSNNYEGNETITASAFTYCDSLWECTVSTFYAGLRFGGGIGDGLIKPDLEEDTANYYNRILFDITFFILISVILMNVIFGIIIDTFAQLRDIRNEQENHKENICFICHRKRNYFELQNESFLTHAIEIHNVWAYLFFLCYLKAKKNKDCTGLEKYVRECMKREDISFFPTNAKSLRDSKINAE